MNIMIIGSEGFIGSNLRNYFIDKGENVFGADILEVPAGAVYTYIKVSRLSAQWEEVLAHTDFDVCINAAGSGNVSYSVTHPVIDFEANTLDVIRILDSLRKYQPSCRYLHISSAAVYGNPAELPVKESAALAPVSPYGFHKMMSEIICKEYSTLFEMAAAIIRPFSVYGIGLKKQLLWDTCKKLMSSDDITLFGTGEETRDFIHISDFVSVIGLLLQNGSFTGTVYNVASGTETAVRDIAAVFEKQYGKKITFSGERKPGDPVHWKADITSIKKIGFEPKADLEQHVTEYIRWFGESQSHG